MKAITRKEKIMSGENLTPITRREMFLAKAAGQNVKTPTPITREEMFLSMISCGKTDQQQYTAGLYETGSVALYETEGAKAIEGKMIKSWDELVAEGVIHVEDGVVSTNMNPDTYENSSSSVLVGDLILPCDKSVVSLGESAFDSCVNLTGVLISDGVENIGDYSIAYCTSLKKIVTPDGLTTIGNSVFDNDEGITSVGLVGSGADVELSDLIMFINNSVFNECRGLTSVVLPDSITSIGENCFNSCANLTSVTLGSGLTNLSMGLFSLCTSLANIYFNGTVAQWNALTVEGDWKYKVPATEVVCSDGEVSLV